MGQLSQLQTLSTWGIEPEDIAMDYQGGLPPYNRYAEIAWRVNAGMSPAYAARDMGFPTGSKDYTRVAKDVPNWRRGERLPWGVKAVLRLHLMKVFPAIADYEFDEDNGTEIFDVNMMDVFESTNSKFRALCMVASLQYWTGSLSQQKSKGRRNTAKTSRIDKTDIGVLQDVVLELIESLDCDFSDYPTHIQLASYVSRLINQFGLPLGQRSKSDITIPHHIKIALSTLNGECSKEEMYLPLDVIQDFILVFLNTRCTDKTKKGYVGYLFRADTPVEEERTRTFRELMEVGYMGLPLRVLSQKDGMTRVILPEMTDETMFRMQSELRGRISSMAEVLN